MLIHSPIQFAINYTKSKIPLKLIKLAIDSYKNLTSYFNHPMSTIEQDIEKFIIREIILPRCNIEAGKMKECVLTNSMVVKTTYRETDSLYGRSINSLYEIPPEEREYRDISKVICVKYRAISGMDTPYNTVNNTSSMLKQARAMLSAQTFDDAWIPPAVELVEGTNMVRLTSPMMNHVNWILQFLINYPESFDNIEKSSWEPFADLVVFGTQMFIYNNLVIDIDQAAMRSGVQIGAIRDIVYDYKESEEKFRDAMNSFIATERFDEKFQIELGRMML